MNDTVKLIIEIPKDYYEIIKHDVKHHLTDYRPFVIIGNGIPLDDVKAEIRKLKYFPATSEYELDYNAGLIATIDILDNIGKAESEDKK